MSLENSPVGAATSRSLSDGDFLCITLSSLNISRLLYEIRFTGLSHIFISCRCTYTWPTVPDLGVQFQFVPLRVNVHMMQLLNGRLLPSNWILVTAVKIYWSIMGGQTCWSEDYFWRLLHCCQARSFFVSERLTLWRYGDSSNMPALCELW